MRIRIWWFIGAAALVVAALAVLVLMHVPPSVVLLKVDGTPGVRIRGTCLVDGKPLDVVETIPTDVRLEGREVEFSILKTSEPGKIEVHMEVNGDSWMSASTESAGGGVEGRFSRTNRFGYGGGIWTR